MKNLALIALLTLSVNIAAANWQMDDRTDDGFCFDITSDESVIYAATSGDDSCLVGTNETASDKSKIREENTAATNSNRITRLKGVSKSSPNNEPISMQNTVSAYNAMKYQYSGYYIRHHGPFVICLGIVCEIILAFIYATED